MSSRDVPTPSTPPTPPPSPLAAAARSSRPQPGDRVQARFTKWGGGAHWQWEGRYLGDDEFGRWLASPAGTRCARPGVSFLEPEPWVTLIPREGAWVAGFYPVGKLIRLYVDMATVPTWRSVATAAGGPTTPPCWEVTMVDLDLDVVLTCDGDLFVDDEDEFADHQVELGYPPEVVALAERTAADVGASVAAGLEPFATVGFERLRQVTSAE